MIGTYASAALICAVSMLAGRALLSLAGRRTWSWLEPAVGFGALLTVTGVLARVPGHGTSATLGAIILVVVAAVLAWRLDYRAPGALRAAIPVVVLVVLALSIPFAVSGRWGLLGIGFDNDLGLHLAWAEWLRSGVGPAPDPGYPLGPHGLAVAVAAFPGLNLGQAFVGEIVAIGVLTGLTALAALGGLSAWRRTLAALLVAVPYLGASYFAQAAFKETTEALLVLAVAVGLAGLARGGGARAAPAGGVPLPSWARRLCLALPALALLGGAFFAYSFAGLAWPLAIAALWSLSLPAVRRALRPRAVLRFLLRPATLVAILVLAGLAVVLTLVGPFGFAHGFNQVAGSNTYGPVSAIESLGVWFGSNYRLQAAIGGAHLSGLAGTIGVLALLAGVGWWVWRREATLPIALGACGALYLISLPASGYYSQAKALMIMAPLAMLVAIRPLLDGFPGGRRGGEHPDEAASAPPSAPPPPERRPPGWRAAARAGWAVLAVAFVCGAAYSSFLALRDAPVAPPGHGAELRAFLPFVHGKTVLYAGQDRFAAYELLGAETHVPLVEFPDPAVSPSPEKPFDTGDAYSPIDFDSFSLGTLDRFPYVITDRAAWDSQAPPNFKRIAATPSFILWERTGPPPVHRHTLLEGTEAAVRADCAAPEIRILLDRGGHASIFPGAVIGRKGDWDAGSVLRTGSRTAQTLNLHRGVWDLSLQYFAPFDLTLSAPGFEQPLVAALDGQRPNTISLANNGQFWPAGRYRSSGGPVKFTLSTAAPSTLQRLSDYDGHAYIGELVATRAGPHRIVPMRRACGRWVDWYEADEAP